MKSLVLCSLLVACSSSSFPLDETDPDARALSDTATDVVDSISETRVDAPRVDNPIDPIATGHAWTYDVEIFGSFAGCAAGTQTGKVLRSGTYQGRAAFEVQSFCPGFGTSWYAIAGDVVDLYYKAWIRVVDAPVVAGHSWSNGTATVTWRDEGTVTTRAGTFEHCYRADQAVGFPSYTIFCRGVGPVRWYVKDLSGNGYDAQLIGKSF